MQQTFRRHGQVSRQHNTIGEFIMMESKRSLSRNSLRALIAMVVIGTMPLATYADNTLTRPSTLASRDLHGQPIDASDLQVDMFVRLDQQSVAELNINSVKQTGELASPDAQKTQAARVTAQQNAIRSTLESYGGRVIASHRVSDNGLHVVLPYSKLNAVRGLAGVRSVIPVATQKLDNIDSVPWIGATKVWQSLNITGKGVKVGVIDTGIDYTHANFGGSGSVADFNANNPNVIEPGSFPTAKVVGGYDFAGANYDAASSAHLVPVPDSDPIDHSGHGSHVAGTIGGIGVPGIIGPGVAPDVSLYALKVFGDNGGSTGLTSEAIEWAMDPNGDGDMSDHLDVINMSLGSSFGDVNDPSAVSAANAAALGIIVVASAGNSGAVPYITGAPAVADAAISVAASSPGGRLYSKVEATAPASVAGVYASLEGAGPVTLKQVGPVSGSLVVASPANGCAALTNASAVAGNVALIVRGTCGFITKYQVAQAAGAKAIVVYNDGTSSTRQDPLVMGGLDSTITIPGVMISFTSGNLLSQTAGVAITLSVAPDPTQDDRLADFSSQGPGGSDSSFKPDLTAPGVSIVSTGMGTGTGSANFSGTSMAAPHVTGAAALLRQLHPTLDQSAIKALLQNSTVNANVSSDTKLTRQGVGVIRVDKAAALTSYASPGGVSFGRLNPTFPITEVREIKFTGLTSATHAFTSKLVENRSMPGVKVICPSSVWVNGQISTATHITLKFDPRVSAAANVFDNGLASQTEVDGWCVFSDGKDQLRVGYIAVVDPASSVFVTSFPAKKKAVVRNSGPAVGWAEAFTLAQPDGVELNRDDGAQAVGFRSTDPNNYFGLNVLELGAATHRPFTNISNLQFDFLVDTNNDGVPDVEVLAIDYSYLNSSVSIGTKYVTAQFDLATGNGFIDWLVLNWDFNDNTAIMPFTLASSGGLLPDKFSFELHIINLSDSSEEAVQHGSVDLSKEVIPDLNSFGISAKDKIEVNMKGSGNTLWLLQNNQAGQQTDYSRSGN
jgi:subtilisin family serine protease